jgi:hypothetical protein
MLKTLWNKKDTRFILFFSQFSLIMNTSVILFNNLKVSPLSFKFLNMGIFFSLGIEKLVLSVLSKLSLQQLNFY